MTSVRNADVKRMGSSVGRSTLGTAGRLLAATLGTVLAGTLLAVPPALAVPVTPQPLRGQVEQVDAHGGEVTGTPPVVQVDTLPDLPEPVWPTAASARAVLRNSDPAKAGRTPVTVARAGGEAGRSLPAELTVEVIDRAQVPEQWREGVVLRVGGAPGATTSGTASVSVDYSGFRHAYGAGWASRLRLWQLPQCALTDGDQSRCSPRELRSVNDTATSTVSADAPIAPIGGTGAATTRAQLAGDAAVAAPAGTLIALAAGPNGPASDFTATSLSPSSTWSVGGNSGSFNWSYGLTTPPVHAGGSPSLAVSYSSSSVDGRSNASNNQPSWIGEGFDLGVGSIERRYVSCAEDYEGGANNTKTTLTGDLCWRTDNATLSLNGNSTELVWDKDKQIWRSRNEDGSKIEQIAKWTENERWKVTGTDGTEYYFGLNALPGQTAITDSAWRVPVYGNHDNEPCHQAAFADSECRLVYRWNLDYVVDPRGNTQSYWYDKETNFYGTRVTATAKREYARGGTLKRIDYGTWDRADSRSTTPVAQVVFDTADRCLTSCGVNANWYDTPLDQECLQAATECKDKYSPTFWTKKRLTRITTKIWDTTKTTPAWQDVTRWDLDHTFPSPGDGGDPGLWLKSITKSGLVGGEIKLPPVTFDHEPLQNRVLTLHNTTNSWQRLSKIITETGATTQIRYTLPECTAENLPEAPRNGMRCYPVLGPNPADPNADMVEWWHKYLVESITETDVHLDGGVQSPQMVTRYTYGGTPAWHYADDDGLTKVNRKTWSQFRGYEWVTTQVGAGTATTLTKTKYLRGMHGDRASHIGGTRTVISTASLGDETVYDEDAFAGMVREAVVYNGVESLPVSKTVHVPWQSPATASRTVNGDRVEARYLRNQTTYAATAIGKDGARGWRTGRTHTDYDDTFATVKSEHSEGDLAVTGDETCTSFEYNRNTTKNLLHLVKRTTTVALPCGTAPTSTDDIVSDARSYYDGADSVDKLPTTGAVTKSETLKNWTQAGGTEWENAGQTSYDKFGRMETVTDIKGGQTTTAYTPASGGPTTKITTTSPLKWVSTIELAPYWGSPTVSTDVNQLVTTREYDALGRFVQGWDSGWKKTASPNTPSVRNTYVYAPERNAYPYIKTEALHAGGGYRVGFTILDGFLRARQTQSAALDGTGHRVITDSNYDEYGRVASTYQQHVEDGAPSGKYAYEPEWSVPAVNKISYDLAGRTTENTLWAGDDISNLVRKWATVTVAEGDRTLTTPPAGGTAATVYTDYQGRTTEVRAHNTAAGVNGSYITTMYSYNRKGQLTKVTDPGTNEWIFTYDIKGREETRKDPDAGTSTTVYNKYGEVETTTNGAGEVLYTAYDILGRRTALRDDSATGALRAEWKYDTLWNGKAAKGLLSQAIRYDNNNPSRTNVAYTWEVNSYTARNQVESSEYIIPDVEGSGLRGIWTSVVDYASEDGTPEKFTYPGAGGVPTEIVTTEFHASNGLPNALMTTLPTIGSYVTNQQYTAYGEPTSNTRKINNPDGGNAYIQSNTLYDLATRRVTDTAISPNNAGTVSAIHYDYDPAGNIRSIADNPDKGTAENQCFRYDALRRLTSAWTPKADPECKADPSVANLGGPAPYWTDWTIDNIGNRTDEVSHTSSGDTTTTYAVPASGPNSVRPHSATSATITAPLAAPVTRNITYDTAGNTLTRKGVTAGQTLIWDAEGKLATTVEGSQTHANVYDADGARLIRRDATGTTLYLPGMEVRRAASNGAISATRYYSFGGSTIASRSGPAVSALSWIYNDHQGTQNTSINAVTTSGTYTTTIRRQTPYGETRGAAASWPNQKSFVGGDNDPNGLVHIGAREYDADLGRFISVDPIMDLADPQQWNAYAYAHNNPITFSDPTGLRTDYFDPCCGGNASGSGNSGGTPGGTTSGSGGSNNGSGGGGNSGGGSSGGGTPWYKQVGSGIVNAGKNVYHSSVDPFVGIYNDFKNKGVGVGLISTGNLAFESMHAMMCLICTQLKTDYAEASKFIDAARNGDVEGMTEVVAGRGIEIGLAVIPFMKLKLPVRAPKAMPKPTKGPSPVRAADEGAPAPADPLLEYADKVRNNTGVKFASEYTSPLGEKYYGRNRHGKQANGPLKNVLDRVGHHGGCAEVDCLIQAQAAEGPGAITGGDMRTVQTRNNSQPTSNTTNHGEPARPCGRCVRLLEDLRIGWTL
ncbi:RHS repeat-associated core domain-containing protein [Catenuloplanes sp. NPDC051500]|uniref:RHS repeat-associated core domain-containing protein n=1 Tax=Catenuloplanes sp. NPDC051500 TaxID=3363959 RepID=UPI0037A827B0